MLRGQCTLEQWIEVLNEERWLEYGSHREPHRFTERSRQGLEALLEVPGSTFASAQTKHHSAHTFLNLKNTVSHGISQNPNVVDRHGPPEMRGGTHAQNSVLEPHQIAPRVCHCHRAGTDGLLGSETTHGCHLGQRRLGRTHRHLEVI